MSRIVQGGWVVVGVTLVAALVKTATAHAEGADLATSSAPASTAVKAPTAPKATTAPGIAPAIPTTNPTTHSVTRPEDPPPTSYELTGDVHWTAVSGDTQSDNRIVGLPDASARGMVSIRWAEAMDRPCRFIVGTKGINNASATETYDEKFCDRDPGVGVANSVSRLGANEFITALQVMTNDKNDPSDKKVKGIRVWGRILDRRDGSLGAEQGPSEDRLPNGKDWANKVSCPQGEVATGIKVYHGHFGARGIALACKKVSKH